MDDFSTKSNPCEPGETTSSLKLLGSSEPELEGHAPGRNGVEVLRLARDWRNGETTGESMSVDIRGEMEVVDKRDVWSAASRVRWHGKGKHRNRARIEHLPFLDTGNRRI